MARLLETYRSNGRPAVKLQPMAYLPPRAVRRGEGCTQDANGKPHKHLRARARALRQGQGT